jgi:hypothetical protein
MTIRGVVALLLQSKSRILLVPPCPFMMKNLIPDLSFPKARAISCHAPMATTIPSYFWRRRFKGTPGKRGGVSMSHVRIYWKGTREKKKARVNTYCRDWFYQTRSSLLLSRGLKNTDACSDQITWGVDSVLGRRPNLAGVWLLREASEAEGGPRWRKKRAWKTPERAT